MVSKVVYIFKVFIKFLIIGFTTLFVIGVAMISVVGATILGPLMRKLNEKKSNKRGEYYDKDSKIIDAEYKIIDEQDEK